jgi:hypothetical protein
MTKAFRDLFAIAGNAFLQRGHLTVDRADFGLPIRGDPRVERDNTAFAHRCAPGFTARFPAAFVCILVRAACTPDSTGLSC